MKSYMCITGATGGLGKAFAVECAVRGWDLFITDLSEDSLKVLAASLETTYGVNVRYKTCDLTDHVSRTQLFDYLDSVNFRFNGLINVAGLDFEGPFAERNTEQIRVLLRLNVEANLEMTYSIFKRRDIIRPFRIINVSSLASYYPMPLKAMYAASKRFLLDFSLALREEIRPLGGTVTALCPAGMPTTGPCIRAIDAQGFLGRITTQNVGYVASKTLDHAMRGDAIYIPGVFNKVLKFLGSLVPAVLIARLIGNRWKNAHSRSNAPVGKKIPVSLGEPKYV